MRSEAKKDDKKEPVNPFRRSLDLFSRRNYNLTMLTVFDQPVLNGNCTRRISSSVVLQSLSMLNDSFIIEQSGELARRVAERAGASQDQRVEQAFRMVFLRKPSAEEARQAIGLLERQTQ